MDGLQVIDSVVVDWLIVGFDGDLFGDFEVVQFVVEYSGFGLCFEEQFQIMVVVVVNCGDVDIVVVW